MRNPDSRRCEAHHFLSRIAAKRILLSGTFCVNTPFDLAGQMKAGNCPRALKYDGKTYDLQDQFEWVVNKNVHQVNRLTVKCFQELILDRATKKILDLPPLSREAVNFDVGLPYEAAHAYNEVLQCARALKARIERAQGRGADAQKNMTQLIAKFTWMQQAIVSPVLAQHSAAAFNYKTEAGRRLLEEASQQPTGAMHALAEELYKLRSAGHRNIVIAANHTTVLDIAKKWIEREHPLFGTCFEYKGELNQKKRVESKKGFLRSPRSLMFLSIGAGGVGLHLVPKPEGIIFWGSMPFSPAHVEQAWNRIHRIGQHAPITNKVTVVHMVAYGSVDYGIGTVHGDKQALINLVQEGDDTGFGGDSDSQWRKGCRIVDACLPLDDAGSFGPMPFTRVNPANQEPIAGTTFTVLPNVLTRGREPTTAEKAEMRAFTEDAEEDALDALLKSGGVGRSALRTAGPSGGAGFSAADVATSLAALRAAGVAI